MGKPARDYASHVIRLGTLGTIGGVIPCVMYEGDVAVAKCNNTPNARAYAYTKHPLADHTRSHYPGWGVETMPRGDESPGKIANAGWIKTDVEAGYRLIS